MLRAATCRGRTRRFARRASLSVGVGGEGRRYTPGVRCGPLLLVCLLTVCVAPLGAQERYTLGDANDWQAQPLPDPGTPEGQLQPIRRAIAQGQAGRAKELADRWIKAHPNHPYTVEALMLRGDARSLQGRYFKALRDYEDVIRFYPASEQYLEALDREFEIAKLFTQGLNRHFLGFRMLPAEGEGEELLIRLQERAPGSRHRRKRR